MLLIDETHAFGADFQTIPYFLNFISPFPVLTSLCGWFPSCPKQFSYPEWCLEMHTERVFFSSMPLQFIFLSPSMQLFETVLDSMDERNMANNNNITFFFFFGIVISFHNLNSPTRLLPLAFIQPPNKSKCMINRMQHYIFISFCNWRSELCITTRKNDSICIIRN